MAGAAEPRVSSAQRSDRRRRTPGRRVCAAEPDRGHGNDKGRDAPHPVDRAGGTIDPVMVPWRTFRALPGRNGTSWQSSTSSTYFAPWAVRTLGTFAPERGAQRSSALVAKRRERSIGTPRKYYFRGALRRVAGRTRSTSRHNGAVAPLPHPCLPPVADSPEGSAFSNPREAETYETSGEAAPEQRAAQRWRRRPPGRQVGKAEPDRRRATMVACRSPEPDRRVQVWRGLSRRGGGATSPPYAAATLRAESVPGGNGLTNRPLS
jgi:hypothetical protein